MNFNNDKYLYYTNLSREGVCVCVCGLAVVIVCFPEYDENNEHMSQLLTIFLTFKARVSSKALHANPAKACDSWSAIKRIHTCIHYARRS